MSTPKLQKFYKSRKWGSFVQCLRDERTDPDGILRCAKCGQPIIKAYDCIGHHIEELTDENVDDANISLNPDNVDLVHFRCHNEIHKRFGFQGCQSQKVYLVYGAPCSGKNTWVRSISEKDDLIVDIDRLWASVRSDICGEYDKPNALKPIVFGIRDALMDAVRVRQGRWSNAYIIGGYPLIGERERLCEQLGVDKEIFIDESREVCLARAKLKSKEWSQYVDDWFDKYAPGTTMDMTHRG